MRTATRILRGKRPHTRRGINPAGPVMVPVPVIERKVALRGNCTSEAVRLKVNPFTLHNPLVIVEGSKV